MSDLAYNKNGEPFEPHDDAAYWRARRCRDRGLEVVYKRGHCTPLTMPINTTEAEFAKEVGYVPGKYRLDQLDETMQPVANAPAAYVYVHATESAVGATEEDESGGDGSSARMPLAFRYGAPLSAVEQLLHLTVEANTRMAEHVIRRFGGYMDSGAHLVRAADGAGMPARAPVPELRNADVTVVEESGEDDSGHATWLDIINNCLPYVEMGLGALLGRRRNAKNANAAPTPNATAPRNSGTTAKMAQPDMDDGAEVASDECAPEPSPVITPAMRAHFMAIYAQLAPDEATFAREVAGELSEAELADWMLDLSTLSVDDAVDKVKAKIAELKATASEEVAS